MFNPQMNEKCTYKNFNTLIIYWKYYLHENPSNVLGYY